MPHQCVRCGVRYPDTARELLAGCACGGKLFFYLKKEHIEAKPPLLPLSPEKRAELERDVRQILDIQDPQAPVVLDFEAIRALQPGKYEIDLVKLFSEQPIVVKLAEGRYVIDLPGTFEKFRKSKS